MDAFKGWRYAPTMALYQGRQSLSNTEAREILAPLGPGQWASERIQSFREKVLNAEKVNISEDRAAGHWALRAAALPESPDAAINSFAPQGKDLMPRMREVHEATREIANQVRDARLKSQSGKPFSAVLHLGIGGSDIGPRLLIQALGGATQPGKVSAEFLSNLDYHAAQHALCRLDPHETLVVIASKSFTTQETVMNAQHVLHWMRNAGVEKPEHNCIAVTERTDRAVQWGVPAKQTLWFDESIGGRFSVWGPVALTARIVLGNAAVDAFIQGGALLDSHFLNEAPQNNLPAVLAVTDFYNLRQRKLPTLMVSAYDSRLALLVPYLKQLWMESLGKHVDAWGKPIEGLACPILWGDVGTNAQHAFFQLLHQGAQGVAIELLGVVEPAHESHESHRALLANLVAQAQALSTGREDPDPNKSCWGGHPLNVLMLDRCDAKALGALIALWEHRVECMAALTGINPFDQWGVELGKVLASSASQALTNGDNSAGHKTPETLDAQSLELANWIRLRLAEQAS